jgi:hypothetical protein
VPCAAPSRYGACVRSAGLLGGLRIRTRDFATGLAVVAAIGAAVEEMNPHPT